MSLKENVLNISAAAKSGMSIDNTGAGTVTDDLFYATLPDHITREVADDLSNHRSDFIAGVTHAFGELATEACAKNKSLDTCSVKVGMAANDSITLNYQRSKTYTNAFAKEGEPKETTKFGVISADIAITGGKNAGQLKRAREEIGKLAFEKLSK